MHTQRQNVCVRERDMRAHIYAHTHAHTRARTHRHVHRPFPGSLSLSLIHSLTNTLPLPLYPRYEVIGNPPNVAVPTHFFKVVLVENDGGADRAIAGTHRQIDR
jgi:hypothetical protein